jgi:16S rRNA (guanine1207-N2)-methyltransferase
VQGFKPDHDAFAARGFEAGVAPRGDYAAAVVFVPRSKSEARALVAEAAALVPRGAPVIVDGAKTDGVDSLLKECRRRAEVGAVVSKAHGKAFALRAPGAFADWTPGPEGAWETAPGGFSEGGVDRGSAMLADALPARLPRRVVDLGAGWGYLSARVLERPEVGAAHLVEAEWASLEAARRNVADPRAVFHWADALSVEAGPFDMAVCNPPFHRGRAADPALGRAFIEAAARLLTPRGALWCVANRHLPYERTLAAAFAEHEEVAGDAAYKVIRAERPIGARRRAA